MKVEGNASPRRWAPEWIAVLTLAVAIVALGGSLFTSLNAMEVRLRSDLREMREDMRLMETRIREDMRSMEARIREDMASMEAGIREDMASMEAGIREDMASMEAGIRKDMGSMEDRIREDMREVRADLGNVRERVTRLETRFDEEFRAAPTPAWSCYSAVAPPSTDSATPWMCRADPRRGTPLHRRCPRRSRGADSARPPPTGAVLIRTDAHLLRFVHEHRSIHRTRTDRVDADILPRVVDRHRARERDDRALRRAVGRHPLPRHDPPRGGDVYDDAAPRRHHFAHRRPAQVEHRTQIDGDGLFPLLVARVRRVAVVNDAGAVDEHVEASESPPTLRDQGVRGG